MKNEKNKGEITLTEIEKKMIDKKLLELRNDNIAVLLEPMTHSLRHKIKLYLKDREDIKIITIGEEGKDRRLFILKHKSYNTKFNMSKKISNALKSYWNKNYHDTIIMISNILIQLKYPNYYFYEILALSYLRTKNYSQALKFLIIAQGLSEYTNKKCNHYDLIKNLSIKVEKEKQIEQRQYKENKLEILGIKKINIIAKEIYINKGNIDIACKKLDLSDEENMLIKIICAKAYYQDGNYIMGDILLKQVEKMKDKTNNIKNLIEETRKNKKFYKNQKDKTNKKLIKILQNVETHK